MARTGIEPWTSDLQVKCPTDCAMQPGQLLGKELALLGADSFL